MNRPAVSLRFAIIGDPVDHSLSPLLHGTAFRALGIDATYERLRIPREDLKSIWTQRLSREFDGWNVTLPLKEAVIPLIDEVDAVAASVGAVNTICRVSDRLYGTNTDILGIQHTLVTTLPSIRHQPVVVIGAGGTARSVTAALARDVQPSRVTFVVRDPGRATGVATLARDLLSCPVDVIRTKSHDAESALSDAGLIVQTSPAGMSPNDTQDPASFFASFRKEQVVFDVIYRPPETVFLRRAAQAGCRVMSGVELFLQQGAAAFQIWTGRAMPLDAVRPAILAALAV